MRMSHLFHETGVGVIPSAIHCQVTKTVIRSKGDIGNAFLLEEKKETAAQQKANTPRILPKAGEKCKLIAANTAKKAPAVCQGFSIRIL